jgi:hypothetical protein
LLGRAQAWLGDHVALVRHRAELRSPGDVWSALEAASSGEQADRADPSGLPGLIGERGQGLSRQHGTYSGPTAATRFLTDELLGDYETGGSNHAAAEQLVRDLHGRGYDVVLLVLPVTADYRTLHPGGPEGFEEFLQDVGDLGADAGAPVIDLHDELGDGFFADTHHLNGAGTRAVSEMLPELVRGGRATTCNNRGR